MKMGLGLIGTVIVPTLDIDLNWNNPKTGLNWLIIIHAKIINNQNQLVYEGFSGCSNFGYFVPN